MAPAQFECWCRHGLTSTTNTSPGRARASSCSSANCINTQETNRTDVCTHRHIVPRNGTTTDGCKLPCATRVFTHAQQCLLQSQTFGVGDTGAECTSNRKASDGVHKSSTGRVCQWLSGTVAACCPARAHDAVPSCTRSCGRESAGANKGYIQQQSGTARFSL